MIITDESFEDRKNRYIQLYRLKKEKFLNKSRNSEKANTVFGIGFEFLHNLELDEFSQEVSFSFNYFYDLGQSIDEILDHLIDVTRVNYLKGLEQRQPNRTVTVRKKIWKIPLPMVSYYATFDYKGELISKYKVRYNLSYSNLKKKLNSNAKEDLIMIGLLVIRREYIYQKPLNIQNLIIDPYTVNRYRWFKALVKYKAILEFSTELYNSKLSTSEQEIVEKTIQKRKVSNQKIVKWTDGNNKNKFVKLIYALHKAGYLDKGNGPISQKVEKLAPVFGIELGEWESNFSRSILITSNGYNHTDIFDDLKKKYSEIVEERIQNQKYKKEIRKELKRKDDSKE